MSVLCSRYSGGAGKQPAQPGEALGPRRAGLRESRPAGADFLRDHRPVEHGDGGLRSQRLGQRPGRRAALVVESLGDADADSVRAQAGPQPAGQLEMGIGGQTEEDDVLLCGDGFERHRRYSGRGMTLPDRERVALVQQIFHGPAHFAVAEDEHPAGIVVFHVRRV